MSGRRYYQYTEPGLDWSMFYVVATAASWLGALLLALSAACGLFYLTELAEEYSTLAKRILRGLLYVVAFLHALLLLVDQISWWRSLLSFVALASYHALFRRFPWVVLGSTVSNVAIALFVVDNVSWYSYFLYTAHGEYPFWSIVPYFLFMVWSVPMGLFVSLSIEDERIPGGGGERSGGNGSLSGLGGGEKGGGDRRKRSLFSFWGRNTNNNRY